MHLQDLRVVLLFEVERAFADEQLVEDATGSKHVAALIELLSRRLFESIIHSLMQLGQKRHELPMTSTPRNAEDFFRAGLSNADLEIMRAVSQGGSVYENLSDLASDAPPKEYVNERLVLLRQLGLLELRANEKNVLHMCLSSAGSQLLSEVSTGGNA